MVELFGVMVREPFTSTEPMFVIVTLEARVVLQISEPALPCRRLVGLAVRVQVGALGRGGGTIVIHVTLPEALDATSV